MKFIPTPGRVFAEQIQAPQEIGGIRQNTNQFCFTYKVKEVPEEGLVLGGYTPVKKGMTILASPLHSNVIRVDGKDILVVMASQIIGIEK
jgi:hypothetical protein